MTAKLRGRLRPHLAFLCAMSIISASVAIGAATKAEAHATVWPERASIGTYVKTTITIPHGCDRSPTHTIRLSIPEGYIGVKPQPKDGWTVTTRTAAYAKTYQNHGRAVSEGVVEVTWTGGPLADDRFEEFAILGFVADGGPSQSFAFATTQVCEKGEIAWLDMPAAGQDAHSLKYPVPVMQLAQAEHGRHGGHGAASTGDAVRKRAIRVGDLEILEPWARATPAGAKVGGGYLTIINKGGAADRLIKVESAVAGHSEIHEMAVANGIMTMRPLANGLDIKPGETVQLKPGGYHLMFMSLKQPLKEGEPFKARLTFERAGAVDVELGVRGISGRPADESDHSGHGSAK